MYRTPVLAAPPPVPRRPRDLTPLRQLADQAFSRAGGAPLVGGNSVGILRDATENYPAWERAILGAERTIHVEMYIIHRDAVGRWFIDLLARKARQGVKVRLAYDWFGCGVGPALGLLTPLIRAGGDVRPFNPPRLGTALGWLRRNHRKLIVIDSEVAFISGLCLGRMWAGDPKKRREPWRDTGTEIRGPAVAHAEAIFIDTWRLAGGGRIDTPVPDETEIAPAGDVDLRLIATEPFTAAMLRVDLLVAAMARRSLWIADAYFIAHGPFVSALQQAAEDGVDVRLLMPQGSDVGWTVPMSRTLYRTLLDSGIRIFEWNGSMMHSKTAVADGRWARIGSTNLNLNSWIGNWELDVAIEDNDVAGTMERHYEEDLARATEIVPAPGRRRFQPVGRRQRRRPPSARRALRTVTRLSNSIGAAVTGNRQLESWESAPLLSLGLVFVGLAVLGWWQPRVLVWPAIVLFMWIGLSFLAEGLGLWRKGQDDP